MQSRVDDVTLSADIVERWLDSNVEWLERYLQHRKPFKIHRAEDAGESATTSSPIEAVARNDGRTGSVVATPSHISPEPEPELCAAPVKMQLVRTRSSNHRGSDLGDSSSVRRSTSWTRKELSMSSRDNCAPGSTNSSPNLIVLTGDSCPANQQHQACTGSGNGTFGQSEGSQQQHHHHHHQRNNSKKHLRYDFAMSRVGRVINGKIASGGTSISQQQQQQPSVPSATASNTGTSGNSTVILTAEPSFASFDGFLDVGMDELRPADARTLAERRRSSLRGLRQCMSLPPQSSGSTLRMLIESRVHLPRGRARHGGTISLDELQTKRELNSRLNSRDFFLEIVRDVSCDLDLDNLVRKILVNVTVLVTAERVTLHVIEGSAQYSGCNHGAGAGGAHDPAGNSNMALVSHSYDARGHSDDRYTSAREPRVTSTAPWGHGVVGYVAETGNVVNTSTNAQAEIDHQHNDVEAGDETAASLSGTGRTSSLVCLPIHNADGDVIAVCSVYNKATHHGQSSSENFTNDDEKMLATYLAFCGMAISNAQAIEAYSREYDRNKALLEVVHDLFEEQTSVEAVVTTIMQRAQTLLQCERCVVVLDEHSTDVSSSASKAESSSGGRLFELQNPSSANGTDAQSTVFQYNTYQTALPPSCIEVAGQTRSGQNTNDQPTIYDVASERTGGFNANGVLCKPIRNSNFQTIGAAQLINKLDGSQFNEADEQLFEAFTIFCGLGINNCLLYDEMARASAKQAVALEVLSYHATVPSDQVHSFKQKHVPSSIEWRLNCLDFDDFSLPGDDMVLASLRIFCDTGLIKTFKIDYETLVRWLLTVRKNYRNVAYHNWRHAFNVCQCMFAVLQTCQMRKNLSDIECLALIVACLCHDLDHRGTNNSYQHKSSSALAQLYGTDATLEHHHFNHAVMILNSEGHNIFANLSSDDYGRVMNVLKDAILATDLSLHIQVRKNLVSLVESGQTDWSDVTQRQLLRSALMTTCDIAAITKPWDIQLRAANLVITEFFDQGDKEKRELKIQPLAIMDRERQDELPALQLEWIDGICLPLYRTLSQINSQLQPMLDNVLNNRQRWQELSSQKLLLQQ